MRDQIVRILSEGLTSEALYEELNVQTQPNKAALNELLAEMVKDGTLAVGQTPSPRYRLLKTK